MVQMIMIELKDIQGRVIYSTEINNGAKRKLQLMKEDYITLPFSLERPIGFGLGTYVEINEGLFEVVDLQRPVLNNSTGGYDYQLRLDAYYWKWKNKIFKFTPEVGGQEASWSLTASLDVHLGVFLKNLKALGYNYRGIEFEFSIDATVENKALSMTYNNTNMIDALSAMAESWQCEWWVTDNVIHFGRCEYGAAVDFEIGVNVDEMTASESQSPFATRLYVFGSTRNLPKNYRLLDEGIVVSGVVQKRLMLPVGTPYIDAYEGMTEEEAIEEVVVIEDIYPRTQGEIDSVETYQGSVENEDGTTSTETFYRFKDSSINFSSDYILEGEEIRIKFESGLLNGMEFGLMFNPNGEAEKNQDGSWNPIAQLFEVVANEDYGRKLPDTTLRPQKGDKYILLNWDSTKIADLGLVAKAENELLEEGKKILAKRKIDPSTYSCKMMSNYMYGLNSEGQLDESFSKSFSVGDKVNLINKAYFNEGRESRIIGFEYFLDYPYDNPTYQVGESAPYSRIGALESKVESLQLGGITYTQVGGSGVYVIGTNDTTSPTDRNVYSALRSDKTFLRKDKSERTPFAFTVGGNLTAEKSLILGGKQINDITRFYDDEKPAHSSDAEIYSALMTDMRIEEEFDNIGERFIRKDVEDTAHKHITFEEGITVKGLAKAMNLEVEELATIARAIVTTLSSSKFVDGFAGEGYQIWKDIASGDWNMTLDKLTVRKVMMIYELVIQKIRSVGGMIVVSAANGKVKSVERVGVEYKFTFEDTNTFVQNDLMRCQVFSPSGLKYYWVEVTHVDGENVYARVADFQGVTPAAGDECVLMGNTKNKLRQNMLLISAAEDGQPRFDCYDGIRTKNFEGCLRTRVGCLDGITDSRFPSDMQPRGYGLYADNCFLTGVFVLSNGKDVQTQFAIMEGMIRTEISSVRSEINAKDNYLSNASFSSNLESWSYENNVRVFNTSGGLLHFNGDFYSIKDNFAGVVAKDSKNVLRIKNSFISQNNSDYNLHPSFDKQVDGYLYTPRMFYISFKYMCASAGTLKISFKNEENDGTFESYEPIVIDKSVEPNLSFEAEEFEGKWNGTGDFHLSFDGDIFIYDLALSDNALADVEEKFTMRFEATDRKIQANLDEIQRNGELLEEYHSEFKLTAQSLESSFNTKLSNQYTNITKEYGSKITQTAQSLTSEYTELVSDTERDITSAYKSLVSQTAREIRSEMAESIEDLEDGLVEDYESQISLTARELRTEFSSDMTDLETGLTSSYKSAISQSAKEIRADLASVEEDLDGRITTNSTNISVQAGQIKSITSTVESHGATLSSHTTLISQNTNAIELKASKDSVDKLTGRVTAAESNITTTANNLSAFTQKITFDSSGNITNFSKSGLYTTSNRATLYSSLVSDGMATNASLSAYTKKDDLGNPSSGITISADLIDLKGKVSFSDLDTTVISGGYILSSLINVDTLVAKKILTDADTKGYTINISNGTMTMKSSSHTAVYLNADNYVPALVLRNSSGDESILNSSGLVAGGNSFNNSGVTLDASSSITRLKVGNVHTSTLSSSTDFCCSSSSRTLSAPTSSDKGKVIFSKSKGGSLTVKNVFLAGDSSSKSTYTWTDTDARIFISDGSYWYEFHCS